MGAGAPVASGRVRLGRKTGDGLPRSGRTGGPGPTFKNSFRVTIDFAYIFIYIGIYRGAMLRPENYRGCKMNKEVFDFICKECGATTQKEFIAIGGIYGALRVIGKLNPYEAAKETIKQFKKGVKDDVASNV